MATTYPSPHPRHTGHVPVACRLPGDWARVVLPGGCTLSGPLDDMLTQMRDAYHALVQLRTDELFGRLTHPAMYSVEGVES